MVMDKEDWDELPAYHCYLDDGFARVALNADNEWQVEVWINKGHGGFLVGEVSSTFETLEAAKEWAQEAEKKLQAFMEAVA